MNIDDVAKDQVPEYSARALEDIFARQRELMVKYEPIEKASGLQQTPNVPVDINDKFGQARLKDFAWRVTEEITESTEAVTTDLHHAREEAADALHFMVELFILAGLDTTYIADSIGLKTSDNALQEIFKRLPDASPKLFVAAAYGCIEALGKATNCLKQRPWKQTHILTDEHRFYTHLLRAFSLLCNYCASIGHTSESLFEYYFRKSEVNKFRQRSQY